MAVLCDRGCVGPNLLATFYGGTGYDPLASQFYWHQTQGVFRSKVEQSILFVTPFLKLILLRLYSILVVSLTKVHFHLFKGVNNRFVPKYMVLD